MDITWKQITSTFVRFLQRHALRLKIWTFVKKKNPNCNCCNKSYKKCYSTSYCFNVRFFHTYALLLLLPVTAIALLLSIAIEDFYTQSFKITPLFFYLIDGVSCVVVVVVAFLLCKMHLVASARIVLYLPQRATCANNNARTTTHTNACVYPHIYIHTYDSGF